MEEAAPLFANYNYKVLKKTEVADRYWVSTIWLGLDHNWSDSGPPLIFETMIFPNGSYEEVACDRYSTEEEAFAGHEVMVQRAVKLIPFYKRWWLRIFRRL